MQSPSSTPPAIAAPRVGVTARPLSRGLVYWHLLSLDAPTVAVAWTWLIGLASGTAIPAASLAGMGVAVWMLYVADRLLDARKAETPDGAAELEERHRFHHRHRTAFLFGLPFAGLLLPFLLRAVPVEALQLYLFEGALLFAYFVLIHVAGPSGAADDPHAAHRLPKELAVGLFFAAAVFIPTVARRPELRLALLPDALLVAAMCSLNCLFIYRWEHEDVVESRSRQPHLATRLALRRLPSLALAIVVASLFVAVIVRSAPPAIPVACAMASSLLLVLDRRRHRMESVVLRAAADLALLTPLAAGIWLR